MIFYENPEYERINRLIIKNGMTEEQFFAAEINNWINCPMRLDQIKGEEYYNGKQDILLRQREIIGENGQIQVVENLPNNKIIDNQYALMVDQKTNYLVGKPFTVSCENKEYADKLNDVFDNQFRRILKYVCEDSLKGGIGWIYPYYNDDGELDFKHFANYEILPFWADDDHTRLDCAVRLYPQVVWDGLNNTVIQKVEIYKLDGLYRYIYQDGTLIPDIEAGEHENYFTRIDEESPEEWNWKRIPLIPFKYNKQEIPLLNRVKTLQDGINTMLSDFENNMQEDARNTILVIKNYDGQDLGEFRRNLATFGAVKVREDGGVDTLSVDVNATNYNEILDVFKKALIANARGYDAKDERMNGNPNEMNIQSMYSDIDLDANGMETEYQAAFDDLIWFIDAYLANSGQGDYSNEVVNIVFNRDILINATETIENCIKSVGLLSDETIIEQHPWVKDSQIELQRIKDEQAEKQARFDLYQDNFTQQQTTETE